MRVDPQIAYPIQTDIPLPRLTARKPGPKLRATAQQALEHAANEVIVGDAANPAVAARKHLTAFYGRFVAKDSRDDPNRWENQWRSFAKKIRKHIEQRAAHN